MRKPKSLPCDLEALRVLPWRQQMAMRMVYVDQLSQEEAARRLGVTRKTVATDLREALARLERE